MSETIAGDIPASVPAKAAAPGATAPRPRASTLSPPRDEIHAGRMLGAGEAVLWEGRPSAFGLALRAFRIPIVAAYFVALAGIGLLDAHAGRTTVGAALMPLLTGAVTIGLLFGLAAIVARSTRYRITTDRIILNYGAILPRTLSLPFRQVGALHLAVGRSGRGDIALALRSGNHIPYLKLWPHVRPWRLRRPEIMLRDVADPGPAATRLARMLGEQRSGADRREHSNLRHPKAPRAAWPRRTQRRCPFRGGPEGRARNP